MGCLTRVGCLVVLATAGVIGARLYSDRLPEQVQRASREVGQRVDAFDSARTAARDSVERSIGWVSIGAADIDDPRAEKARAQLRALASDRGPAFVTLSAADAAAMLSSALARALPATASDLAVAFSGEQVLVRANVDLRDFTGTGALGGLLGGAIGGRDQLRLAGTLDVVQPGFADFRIASLRLKGVDVPTPLLAPLLRIVRQRAPRTSNGGAEAPRDSGDPSSAGTSTPDDALRLALPSSVADLRVRNGRLTLYRAVPAP